MLPPPSRLKPAPFVCGQVDVPIWKNFRCNEPQSYPNQVTDDMVSPRKSKQTCQHALSLSLPETPAEVGEREGGTADERPRRVPRRFLLLLLPGCVSVRCAIPGFLSITDLHHVLPGPQCRGRILTNWRVVWGGCQGIVGVGDKCPTTVVPAGSPLTVPRSSPCRSALARLASAPATATPVSAQRHCLSLCLSLIPFAAIHSAEAAVSPPLVR